jgi:hypothetical protein
VLPSEQDDLEVQAAPGQRRIQLLEVALGLLDRPAVREAPAGGQPVDVGVDREGGLAEGLRHHDAGGLVAHAGQRLERFEVGGHLPAVLPDQELRKARDRLGFRRRETAGADHAPDLRDRQLRHRLRRRGAGEQERRDLVHLDVGALRGEEHGDQQGVRIPVLEGDLDLGVDVVEDPADPTGFVRALHEGPSITWSEGRETE